jgi:FlaG/FlaF family flagellin (archaellin)
LIAITVVLAATLVTILGGFTHGAGNTVEAAGVTPSINTNNTVISMSVSTSSQNLNNDQVSFTLTINGSFVYTGLLSNHLANTSSSKNSTLHITSTNSSFTGGTVYTFHVSQTSGNYGKITSYKLTLNYKGTQFYSSGTQTV